VGTVTFRLLGLSFSVSSPFPDLWPHVSRRLPPVELLDAAAGVTRCYAVYREGADPLLSVRRHRRRVVRAPDVPAAAEPITADIEGYVARRAEGAVLVHAGAVAWRGRALLFPGRSGSGKTELVAACLRAGAALFSDEFAVVDAAGTVHPWARPLGLRAAGRAGVSAAQLGAPIAAEPLPVAAVVFLRYRRGARLTVEPLTPGEALLGLLRHTVAGRERFQLARDVFSAIALSVVAFRGVRGEADEAAHSLLSLA
jgi:hypothetical protein